MDVRMRRLLLLRFKLEFNKFALPALTQGVQVEGLFKPLFDLGRKISFAWPSFKWDLKGGIVVAIIGMSQNVDSLSPRLWN